MPIDLRKLDGWPELDRALGQHAARTEIDLLLTLVILQAQAAAQAELHARFVGQIDEHLRPKPARPPG